MVELCNCRIIGVGRDLRITLVQPPAPSRACSCIRVEQLFALAGTAHYDNNNIVAHYRKVWVEHSSAVSAGEPRCSAMRGSLNFLNWWINIIALISPTNIS